MNSEINKSSLVTNNSAVREICEPLGLIGITGFFFMRVYNDNSVIDLATHLEWGTHFFSKVYDNSYEKQAIKNHFFPSNYVSLWEHYPENIIWQEGKNFFRVGNGISIVHKHENYNEIFSFFTDSKNFKLNEFYINNIHLLEKFILYFKDRAKQLINESEGSRLVIPSHYLGSLSNNKSSNPNFDHFLDSINIGNSNELLSKRECECLYWVALGKTAEEIGSILRCSKRTIEFHINNAKTKTNTSKITALIYQAAKSGLI